MGGLANVIVANRRSRQNAAPNTSWTTAQAQTTGIERATTASMRVIRGPVATRW